MILSHRLLNGPIPIGLEREIEERDGMLCAVCLRRARSIVLATDMEQGHLVMAVRAVCHGAEEVRRVKSAKSFMHGAVEPTEVVREVVDQLVALVFFAAGREESVAAWKARRADERQQLDCMEHLIRQLEQESMERSPWMAEFRRRMLKSPGEGFAKTFTAGIGIPPRRDPAP